ncbi:glycosyltransferase [Sulfobacillus thermosulfidooxidans]|uniref:glycosyltransferase n=1 Tax=Sulfobacillus thermosulfidooxidans TaxID=28034 RepID=UPI0006B5946C|nr:glycosyltransferase [Sulfobacillus thermosulfidooxidans]
MNPLNISQLNDFEDINLIDNWGRDNPLANRIDPAAFYMLEPHLAKKTGLFPFAWDQGVLCVAISRPLQAEYSPILDKIGPVRFYRTHPLDIMLAQQHIFRHSQRHKKFGEIALEQRRLLPEQLNHALTVQNQSGAKLGQICVAANYLTAWDVCEILHYQTGIATISLLNHREAPHDPRLNAIWDLMEENNWRQYEMVPVRLSDDDIVVAVTNPFDGAGRAHFSQLAQKRVRTLLTGRRDIEYVLSMHYQEKNLRVSKSYLVEKDPDNSAIKTVTKPQMGWFLGIAVVIIGFLIWQLTTTLTVISSLFITLYAFLVGYRVWIILQGARDDNEIHITDEEIAQLDEKTLPAYTILIPVRDEVSVLPTLMQALDRLDYPKDRLDVKLLLEEDDIATIRAAREIDLPHYVDLVVVPVSEPRTKPKACNFGLQKARGEFITIYDAEDVPEPRQLKKALVAFQHYPQQLACVQAKLSYFNAEQNILTRWFTAEYGSWFDLFLPALYRSKLPIPLGGTSNHFRTTLLHQVGAWDPFNVTEDADLGIRLHKAGYRTAVIDSLTYEEANSEFVNWIRQRSRWIKGYLQTWLVHMRHPRKLRRELGWRGFIGFQMSILGTPLMFILNPFYWFITSLWFMTHWQFIPALFPPGIYYLGMLNLLVGNFIFTYLNAIGAAKRGNWHLIPYTLFAPVYWSMMSLASWKAVIQLITRPSHWEKTIHGLVDWHKVVPEDNPESLGAVDSK